MAEGQISILAQRRIEAAFARAVLAEMEAAIGPEAARAILSRAILRLAEEAGAALAAETPVPSLAHFAASLERWCRDDALTIEVLRQDATHFDFNVTRCRYAETYRAMGLAELGAILSCNRDGALCRGYHPALKLERRQTIMEGAPCCDFRYRWEEEPAGGA
ncbi:MAG: L-2-amino-thiazoline-4-carboxylic acid hydrolase [Rhodovarius sp.]|nr:L-2-amino-thiazoline-4-carboxylic acid hydrolase [Rhodovarius sp.]MCX7932158.1 L-2-amino-thiazoline-4-carboxylic acid hydrolase [Rhodovarius sp.]MDW8314668.1 L-2-amino-thiazoline-4-carboxylic acid hydrolase [Rhodovarius sp.]